LAVLHHFLTSCFQSLTKGTQVARAELANTVIFRMSPFWKYKLDHVLFWTATVLFHMYTRWALIDHIGISAFVLEVIIRNGLLATLIYLNLKILIPRFAKMGRWFSYGTLLVSAMLLYAVLKDMHDAFLESTSAVELSPRFINQTFYNISIAVFYVSFSVALELSREWSRQREQLRQIAFDQVETELAYLKPQINPHFLFNSINTIYFQIDKENRIAREMLAAFSDMLRYQLYECNGNRIPIEKEVAYLRNYVELQRMRKDGNYSIKFSADSNVAGFQIAPLLLMPFVENAFKHVSHAQAANKIEIALSHTSSKFKLVVYNTRESPVVKGAVIGLRNAKRRLELLYNGRHMLLIEDGPTSFRVQLEVLIDAHFGQPQEQHGSAAVKDSIDQQQESR
jgi:two-component system, LytTR family, sensor kinase